MALEQSNPSLQSAILQTNDCNDFKLFSVFDMVAPYAPLWMTKNRSKKVNYIINTLIFGLSCAYYGLMIYVWMKYDNPKYENTNFMQVATCFHLLCFVMIVICRQYYFHARFNTLNNYNCNSKVFWKHKPSIKKILFQYRFVDDSSIDSIQEQYKKYQQKFLCCIFTYLIGCCATQYFQSLTQLSSISFNDNSNDDKSDRYYKRLYYVYLSWIPFIILDFMPHLMTAMVLFWQFSIWNYDIKHINSELICVHNIVSKYCNSNSESGNNSNNNSNNNDNNNNNNNDNIVILTQHVESKLEEIIQRYGKLYHEKHVYYDNNGWYYVTFMVGNLIWNLFFALFYTRNKYSLMVIFCILYFVMEFAKFSLFANKIDHFNRNFAQFKDNVNSFIFCNRITNNCDNNEMNYNYNYNCNINDNLDISINIDSGTVDPEYSNTGSLAVNVSEFQSNLDQLSTFLSIDRDDNYNLKNQKDTGILPKHMEKNTVIILKQCIKNSSTLTWTIMKLTSLINKQDATIHVWGTSFRWIVAIQATLMFVALRVTSYFISQFSW